MLSKQFMKPECMQCPNIAYKGTCKGTGCVDFRVKRLWFRNGYKWRCDYAFVWNMPWRKVYEEDEEDATC